MSKKVAKGNILLQKEAELQDLLKEYKKISRNLKSNKTRLKNDREKAADIQRKVGGVLDEHHRKLYQLRDELIEAAEKVRKSKKVSKQEKKEMGFMIDDIKQMMPSDEDFAKMAEEFAEQWEQEEYERRLFEKFHKKPSGEELKSIRSVYIKLSKLFHPDLAKSEAELERFNALMIKINDAYESGDIAELLQIQKNLADYESDSLEMPTEEDSAISYIQSKINKKANELKLLKGQLLRTRQELKELRNSEAGEMLAEYKRFAKVKMDMYEQMKLEMNDHLEMLEMIVKNLNEFAKTGELSEEFQRAMMVPDIDYFMEDVIDGEVDLDEFLEILKRF